MNKWICIKTYTGYQETNNWFVYRKKNVEHNFVIEIGTILLIKLYNDGYQDIYARRWK
jgi:hypothetical protein